MLLAVGALAQTFKDSKANRGFRTKFLTVTAYCPCSKCCGRFADGYTASGHHIKPGDKIIAAPPEYEFFCKMDVPGYGEAYVLDRGGKIKGNRIDVLFADHNEAIKWGVQFLPVKIWE
jgi:3D (Asp-Asp-Asp) domain-containing protein